MENLKTYFVSYNHTDQYGNFGFGNNHVTVKKPIETMDDVREIQEHLRNKWNFKALIILNYIELKSER